MRRSFGLATTFVVSFTAIFAVWFPVAAKATPSDTTVYPIDCATSGSVNVYLAYSVNAITFTNPDSCSGTDSSYVSNGRSSTWSYSKTISGTTTTGSYDPEGANYAVGALGSSDSFTLTLTSASSSNVRVRFGVHTHEVFFNTQFNTVTPDPVAIGQQVTVTGNNLSSVSFFSFQSSSAIFYVNITSGSATQLIFTVPLATTYRGVTTNVSPGTYRLGSSTNTGKTLVITPAPVDVSASAEELARQAALVATAKREEAKKFARESIANKLKSDEKITLETFVQAEVNGITRENLEAVQTEIYALPASLSGDITGILKIARKYEIVNLIASDRLDCVYSNQLIEIGLISADSKNKAALTAVVKKLPIDSRSSYAAIQEVMGQKVREIQARKDRSTAILTRIAARSAG
jgi:hypothetical protein